ncbi:MAG: NADH-quinone oxidoreductase subunit C [Thermoplasmata archaeon]|nr:NADH-quinone oxidoreductase subunit C [Thermoplasmata archaeon]
MQVMELKTTPEDLDSKIYKMFQLGARLVVITGNDLGNGKFEIIYHFSKGAEMTNIKIEIEENRQIESVTGLFPYADIMESELLDYFGIKVAGAKPNVFLEAGSGICTPLRKEKKPEEKPKATERPKVEDSPAKDLMSVVDKKLANKGIPKGGAD